MPGHLAPTRRIRPQFGSVSHPQRNFNNYWEIASVTVAKTNTTDSVNTLMYIDEELKWTEHTLYVLLVSGSGELSESLLALLRPMEGQNLASFL